MHKVYLSLGSNLGNRRETLMAAVRRIGELIGDVVRLSALYETEPWGFVSSNKFLNAAVCVETQLSPHDVLRLTQQIERDLGRKKKTAPGRHSKAGLPVYHDRPVDIDILLYDDINIDEADLKIPHPLMREREFVMKPLKEIMA